MRLLYSPELHFHCLSSLAPILSFLPSLSVLDHCRMRSLGCSTAPILAYNPTWCLTSVVSSTSQRVAFPCFLLISSWNLWRHIVAANLSSVMSYVLSAIFWICSTCEGRGVADCETEVFWFVVAVGKESSCSWFGIVNGTFYYYYDNIFFDMVIIVISAIMLKKLSLINAINWDLFDVCIYLESFFILFITNIDEDTAGSKNNN